MFRNWIYVPVGLTMCAVIVLAQITSAQSAPPQPKSTMSAARAYAVVFRVVAAMQKRAADIETTGGKGAGLRRAFSERAGLTATQSDILNRIVMRTEQLTAPLDQQAWALIKAVRDRFPKGKMKPGSSVPPPPEELRVLQQQRDQIVSEAVLELKKELGQEAFAKLDGYVRRSMLTASPRKRPIESPSEIGRPGSPRLSPAAGPDEQ